MIVSVNIATLGIRHGLGMVAKPPRPASVPGLRHADIGVTAPLSGSLRKSPNFGRIALVGFWDDEASLDAFLANDQRAQHLTGGLAARLTPLRAHGTWPGLDADVAKTRAVDNDGPVVVLTLGRFRVSQALRFFRASAKAEAAVSTADGLIWATGLARPPFVGTCSLWESSDAARNYAYDASGSVAPHPHAIQQGNAKPFHKREVFIRLRPISVSGSLTGKNPLAPEQAARV